MKLYWLITILVLAICTGVLLEYFGSKCPKCAARKEKWFGWMFGGATSSTE